MVGPQVHPREATHPEALKGCDVGSISSGKSLEVLLDFVQIFGAVSLFETASSLHDVSRGVPAAFIGVGCMWSFFAISIFHTVGGFLEVFEGEYTKSWAVLGLNWTVNFSGLLLFVLSKLAVQDTSLPWLSMIAPSIQTVVLVYALHKVGPAGHVRIVFMTVAAALLVGFTLYIYLRAVRVIVRCVDVSLIFFNLAKSKGFVVYISEDCFDLEELGSIPFIEVESASNQVYSFENGQTQGTAGTPIQRFFAISNIFPFSYALDGEGVAFAVFVAFFVLFVGGSFVKVVLESRLKNVSHHRILRASIVCGWVVAYPIYEFCRLLPRVVGWLKFLVKSLYLGEYEFRADGTITLPREKKKRPVVDYSGVVGDTATWVGYGGNVAAET